MNANELSPTTPAWVPELRDALLRKGGQIASELADVLGGKDVDLSTIARWVTSGRAPKRPEEKLRAFLDHVEGRRRLLLADHQVFLCCEKCHEPRPVEHLRELPWADLCQECDAG